MDESSEKMTFDAITTGIKMAAMGEGITATVLAADKSKPASTDAARIEKSICELNAKFDRVAEQLKNMYPELGMATNEADKPENSHQSHSKPQQDIIYVRKSSEFSFYN